MSTLIDSLGTVHQPLLTKGEDRRTFCTPLGMGDEHIVRSGKDVDCSGCIAVALQLIGSGPRYDVTMNGSLMGGGNSFRSGLTSAVRVSLRYPGRLMRLHDDVDTDQVILEVRNGAIEDVLVSTERKSWV